MKRRISIIILMVCMVFTSTLHASAFEITNEEDIIPIVSFPQELIDIINGSDSMIDYYGIYGGEYEIEWGSANGRTATHQYITACALSVFFNDMPNRMNFAVFNGDEWQIIMSASDLPDIDFSADLFAGHFYDPNTNENYLHNEDLTAKTNFAYWYNRAVSYYSYDSDYAFLCLGSALHYLQDANEPHHSSNRVAFVTNHTQFDDYVDANRASYGSLEPVSIFKYTSNSYKTPEEILHEAAVFSNGYANTVLGTNNTNVWDQVAEATISKAVEYCACVIYKFAVDVGIDPGLLD